jgi:hypothetical protein
MSEQSKARVSDVGQLRSELRDAQGELAAARQQWIQQDLRNEKRHREWSRKYDEVCGHVDRLQGVIEWASVNLERIRDAAYYSGVYKEVITSTLDFVQKRMNEVASATANDGRSDVNLFGWALGGDFDWSHLSGDSLRAAKVVLGVLHRYFDRSATGGGCTAFYTSDEWRARGEQFGKTSVLVLVHDGGDLAPICNPAYGQDTMSDDLVRSLHRAGFYREQCTCWYSAIYRDDSHEND